jgi:hypothetical protein
MWRERIARTSTGPEELCLVLIEDIAPTGERDEPVCELFVNRNHFSRDREQITRAEFASVAEAQEHCLRKYGVRSADWMDQITFAHTFQFDYTVTNMGVPQPYPIVIPNARILFRLSPAEDENGRSYQVLNICGNREGLERLAAMLVLAANSDKYDPDFHIHLEDWEGIETDMEATIRSPAYMECLVSQQFTEFKGTKIAIPDENTGHSDLATDRSQFPPET